MVSLSLRVRAHKTRACRRLDNALTSTFQANHGSEAVSWLPDESHLLAVEKSVTAHKGGLQRGIVVSLKGRRGGGGGGGGGGTS